MGAHRPGAAATGVDDREVQAPAGGGGRRVLPGAPVHGGGAIAERVGVGRPLVEEPAERTQGPPGGKASGRGTRSRRVGTAARARPVQVRHRVGGLQARPADRGRGGVSTRAGPERGDRVECATGDRDGRDLAGRSVGPHARRVAQRRDHVVVRPVVRTVVGRAFGPVGQGRGSEGPGSGSRRGREVGRVGPVRGERVLGLPRGESQRELEHGRAVDALVAQVLAPHDPFVRREHGVGSGGDVRAEVVPRVPLGRDLGERPRGEAARPVDEHRAGPGTGGLERQPVGRTGRNRPELVPGLMGEGAAGPESLECVPLAVLTCAVDQPQQPVDITAPERIVEQVGVHGAIVARRVSRRAS